MYKGSLLFGMIPLHKISDVYVPNPEKCSATYFMTDSYDNEYWTPVIPND